MRGFKPLTFLSVAAAFTLAACDTSPVATAPQATSGGEIAFSLGNGFPEPGHDFNLHIIGVPQDK